jgi:uncharacterized protein (UPF0548 family)
MERLLGEQLPADVTYPEVGASISDALPAGYKHDRYRRSLGTGDAVWSAACAGLRAWACHDGAGFSRVPAQPALEVGVTLVQGLPFGPGWVPAACRIVHVVDEPDRAWSATCGSARPRTGRKKGPGSGGFQRPVALPPRAR